MLVLTFAVRHMALPFIEVDCELLLTVLAKAVDNPSRHFDGPHSIIRTVADKRRALISFDLNRGRRKQVLGRATPRPCSLCRIPRLPSRIARVSPLPSIEGTANHIGRTMNRYRVREAFHSIAGHQGCQQQRMLCTSGHAVTVRSNGTSVILPAFQLLPPFE
jgi:hypothetical protein